MLPIVWFCTKIDMRTDRFEKIGGSTSHGSKTSSPDIPRKTRRNGDEIDLFSTYPLYTSTCRPNAANQCGPSHDLDNNCETPKYTRSHRQDAPWGAL